MWRLIIDQIIPFLALLSPPFLIFLMWRNFLRPVVTPKPGWKVWLDWAAIIATSGFFAVCLVAAMVIPQDVQKDNWASVAVWRSFTGGVLRVTPFFALLAILGRKKTRLYSALLVLAVAIDCIMIDLMA